MSPQPQAAVGAPLSRVDGRLEVTGRARYAADHDVDGVVHAVLVESTIARGHITGIDTRATETLPAPKDVERAQDLFLASYAAA
ncbi:hypothetical protein OIE52_05585 [Streptomyces canus]